MKSRIQIRKDILHQQSKAASVVCFRVDSGRLIVELKSLISIRSMFTWFATLAFVIKEWEPVTGN